MLLPETMRDANNSLNNEKQGMTEIKGRQDNVM